jgi:cbb3-type cytochrome oxidase subunit FixQ-like protein
MSWWDFAMGLRPIFMVWVALLVSGLLLWYCRPRRSRLFDDYARIPLRDERRPRNE